VASILDEHVELLEAIVSNDDSLTYSAIIGVYIGSDESITALTDDGVNELTNMLNEARLTTKTCHQFLDDFVDDPELVSRFKTQAPR
jgi:hypothetical protein